MLHPKFCLILKKDHDKNSQAGKRHAPKNRPLIGSAHVKNQNEIFANQFNKFFGLACEIENHLNNLDWESAYIADNEPTSTDCGPLEEFEYWKRRYAALSSHIEKVFYI